MPGKQTGNRHSKINNVQAERGKAQFLDDLGIGQTLYKFFLKTILITYYVFDKRGFTFCIIFLYHTVIVTYIILGRS